MQTWWHWARSMREHIDMYYEAATHNPSPEKMAGIAKRTIDGLAKGTAQLAADIQKIVVVSGFPDPFLPIIPQRGFE
jgi:hypothetical protein